MYIETNHIVHTCEKKIPMKIIGILAI